MFFSDRPKVRREDLYDRDEEFDKLISSLKQGAALTVLKGLRRLGKSSLMLVGLAKSKLPYMLIDCRRLEEAAYSSRRTLVELLEESVNDFIRKQRGIWPTLREYLKKVRGIGIGEFSITFAWGGEKPLSIVGLFDTLNEFAIDRGIKIVVAIDEAQQLRKIANFNMAKLLAHIYDYKEGIQLLLTGSQVGLLDDIIGVDDPSSPLYGRARSEVNLGRFSAAQSRKFLEEGFKQVGIKLDREVIEYAVEKLDGIVGWLSNFGWRCYLEKRSTKEFVDQLLKEAGGLALKEFENFLLRRPAAPRYRSIMKRIAVGPIRWTQIKNYLEDEMGTRIHDANLANLLDELVNAGFLECENNLYSITDPVLRYALS